MKAKAWLMLGVLLLVLAGFWFAFSKEEYVIKGKGFDDAPAKLIITEYADFQCPACGTAFPIVKKVKEEYSREKIKIDFRHFPLKQIHPFAFKAAQAAECARDQEKFWEYHDVLFERQRDLRVVSLKKYAKELGLNTEEFGACLGSDAMAPRVEGNLNEGVAAGVRATPTFVIAGKVYQGVLSYEKLKQIVDAGIGA